jgi:hypothetical protein
MSFGIRLSLIICAIGIVTIAAPLVLPRSAFGELGHGDGMGLIGLIMFGAVLLGVGTVMTIIAAVVHNRRVATTWENYTEVGEEKK